MEAKPDIFERLRAVDVQRQKEYDQETQLKENTVFEVVEETTAKEIEQQLRFKGAVKAFLHNVTEHYESWSSNKDNSEKRYMIFLNRPDTKDPFAGKKTDSLYSAFSKPLKDAEMSTEWRVTKHGEDPNKVLVIVKL